MGNDTSSKAKVISELTVAFGPGDVTGESGVPTLCDLNLDASVDVGGLTLRNSATGKSVPASFSRPDPQNPDRVRVELVPVVTPMTLQAKYQVCLETGRSETRSERTGSGGAGSGQVAADQTGSALRATAVRVESTRAGYLRFVDGKMLVGEYRYGADVVRPYLYPLYVDEGVGISRDWPLRPAAPGESTDHVHHKGLYTAHGEVNGVDNWTEEPGCGRQVHRAFPALWSGGATAGFVESLEWTDARGKPNLDETRRAAFYASSGGSRLIDYTVTLHAAYGPVVLGDTKEAGLLSLRLASSMEEQRPNGGKIINSLGAAGESETWGKRAAWCDYSGPIQSGRYGVTMMDHPANPRFPTYWHVRAYGLMAANCFGMHDFEGTEDRLDPLLMAAGESLTFRYRLYLHRGNGSADDIERRYHGFIQPPAVVARSVSAR